MTFLPYYLFISLTYILVSGSVVDKQEEKSGSKRKRDPFGELEPSGASSTSKKRKFQGKDKRKITFSVE